MYAESDPLMMTYPRQANSAPIRVVLLYPISYSGGSPALSPETSRSSSCRMLYSGSMPRCGPSRKGNRTVGLSQGLSSLRVARSPSYRLAKFDLIHKPSLPIARGRHACLSETSQDPTGWWTRARLQGSKIGASAINVAVSSNALRRSYLGRGP